jgi:hypothetical protein
MTKTITRLFDSFSDAERAVDELERMGVPHGEISLIAQNSTGAHSHRVSDGHGAGEDAAAGATAGGALGAAGGFLAGLGFLVIPGFGPVVAAGWVATTLAGLAAGAAVGGATGGLVGVLTHADIPEEEAHIYAEGVRRGGILVSAKVEDEQAPAVEAMMSRLNAADIRARGRAYREEGWSPNYGGDGMRRSQDGAQDRPAR